VVRPGTRSVERANEVQTLYLWEGFRVVARDRDADTMILDLDTRPAVTRRDA
jgi:hypothetical protein